MQYFAKIIAVAVLLASGKAEAQEIHALAASPELESVTLEFYRAVILVDTGTVDSVHVSGMLLDADEFLTLTDSASVSSVRRLGAATLSVADQGSRLVITSASATREVVLIRLRLPADIAIDAVVEHAGSFVARGRIGAISASVFNGPIKVERCVGTVSAETVRSGDIDLEFESLPTQPIIASSFAGDISVRFPGPASFRAQLRSDLGSVETNFQKKNARSMSAGSFEEVAGGVRTVRESIWQRFETGDGEVPVFLYSVRGVVSLIQK